MAGNLSGLYDQTTAPDAPDFSLLPAGPYNGDIAKTELKPTKAGHMISLDIQLENGRHVFDNLNVQCATSQQAERIAQATVKKIGMTNNIVITDTEDMIGCRVRVQVGVQPARGDYPERNVVKFYMDLPGASSARPAPSRPSAPAARPPASPARQAAPPAQSAGRRWGAGRAQPPGAPLNQELDDEIPFN
ncbi:DUF669 domain-containing protein [Acetobacter aceti]|uniref:DUF669 domain-containing protein n=1 Tax=Acetobacter aceti TaxID=435 RepID=UPI000C071D9C|nr:DUF669 domain-containing protein [Acetobacter aceti]